MELSRVGDAVSRPAPRHYALLIFLVALLVRLFWWRYNGAPRVVTPPDGELYIATCDVWTSNPPGVLSSPRGPMFAGFTLPFCGILTLTGGSLESWVTVQIALSALTCVLVYLTVETTVNRIAGLISGLSIVVLPDVFRFDFFVLSDAMFTFVLALSLYVLARFREQPTRTNRALVFGALAWLAVTRPFGPPIVGLWLAFDLLPAESDIRIGLLPRRLAILGVVTAAVVAVPSVVRWGPHVVEQLQGGELWTSSQWGETQQYTWLTGLLYEPRGEGGGIGFILLNLDYAAVFATLRVLLFSVPCVPNCLHDPWLRFNAVFLFVLETLSLVAAIVLVRRRSPLFVNWVGPWVAVLVVVIAVGVTPFFRYRVPLGVIFAILSGYLVGGPLAEWVSDRRGVSRGD